MKRLCTATTTAGRPCQAWAIRDSEPPRCPAHARMDRSGTTREQRSEEISVYQRLLSDQEVVDLLAYDGNDTLGDEIAINRIMLRRLLIYLQQADNISIPEVVKIAALVFRGTRAVTALLRDEKALSGEAADGIAGAIGRALDELSVELGLEL